MIGFGENWPQRPHHRASSCQDMPEPCDWDDFNSSGPNPQVRYHLDQSTATASTMYVNCCFAFSPGTDWGLGWWS